MIELLVVIVVLSLFFTIFAFQVPSSRARATAQRINCINNLKQVGLAYRIWSGDNGGFPMELSVTNRGTLELMGTGEAWRTYQVMSNELSTPRILYCPADEQRNTYATNFSEDLHGKISYFISVDAISTNSAQALLSGDDNFTITNLPVKSGLISLSPNTPVGWSKERHQKSGNIGLADGSVLLVKKNPSLPALISQTGQAANRLFIP